jgi:glycosyltransferase involved in cell wall biosynthesis
MVDVIIPVFNSQAYLSYCLDSVISQSLHNKISNIICINDGSNDSSNLILQAYGIKYEKVKVINQINQKQAIARNNGLLKSNSKYIALLDSDDQWSPNHLELCLYQLDKNNCDIVSTGFYDSYSDGNMLLDSCRTIHPVYSGTYLGYDGINQFIIYNRIATSSVVMRRTVIDKIGFFDLKATPAEDYDLWIRAIKNGFKVKVLSEPTMYYRHHNNSSTSNNKPRWSFNEEFYVLNENFNFSQLKLRPFDVKKSLARKYKNWVRFSNESWDVSKKARYFLKFSGLPFDLKIITLFILKSFRLIEENKLNKAITSRINKFYRGE